MCVINTHFLEPFLNGFLIKQIFAQDIVIMVDQNCIEISPLSGNFSF